MKIVNIQQFVLEPKLTLFCPFYISNKKQESNVFIKLETLTTRDKIYSFFYQQLFSLSDKKLKINESLINLKLDNIKIIETSDCEMEFMIYEIKDLCLIHECLKNKNK